MRKLSNIIDEFEKLDLDICATENVQAILSKIEKIPAPIREIHAGSVIYRASNLNVGEKIENVGRLSYLPPERNDKFQRASTPDQTMFYGVIGNSNDSDDQSNCEMLAMQETCSFFRSSPKDGVYQVAVSKWQVLDTISLLALMNPDATNKSERLNEMVDAFFKFLESNKDSLDEKDSIRFQKFMCEQFTKPIDSDKNNQYRISALFTSKIIKEEGLAGVMWQSSVAIDEKLNNTLCVAIKPQIVDTVMECCPDYSLYTFTTKNAQVEMERKTINIMQNSIFSILYQTDDRVIHTGTGFLIAQNGLFITAGHIFRKIVNSNGTLDPNRFLAYFVDTNTLIKIKTIWFKSLEIGQQNGPEYIDIAVGTLETNNTSYLILDRRRPQIEQDLTLYGYISTKKVNDYGTDFDHLIDLEKITFSPVDMGIKYQDALISENESDYQLNREQVDRKRFFNNCITLSRIYKKGASGCPVMDEYGKVVGILIGSPKITNETNVLLSKWCSKQVQFHTYIKYDPYEYLKTTILRS